MSAALGFAIEGVELWRQRIPAQRPFRFGIVTVDALTQLFARVTIRAGDGRRHDGCAADFAAPRWFRKDPTQSVDGDIAELEQSARAAAAVWRRRAAPARSAFAAWREVYGECVNAVPFADALVAGFGVALVERAVLDAVCRAAGLPFHTALTAGALGFDATLVDPPLAPWLPIGAPARDIAVRHTVGLADELADTLHRAVTAHGITHFKIKIGGEHAADTARLLAVARTLRELFPSGRPLCTLDGNETFAGLDAVAALLEAVAGDTDGAWLLAGLAFVEQPLPRHATFDPARHAAVRRVHRFAPLALDEADVRPGSLRAAWPLGYRGVSAKSCKGVFRALANAAFCARHAGAFLCGEDLTTLPLLPLQQDLALLASLGIAHAERNGHHFVAGLDHLPPAEQTAALRDHPALYARGPDGRAHLRIERGRLDLRSLTHTAGLGAPAAFDPTSRERLA